MTEQFGWKWEKNEGPSTDRNGQPTENFLRWCKETEHFTEGHWRRGFTQVATMKRDAARQGEANDHWPPCSIDFVEYGRPPKKMHRIFDKPALEDISEQERARDAYERERENISAILGEGL